MKKLTIVLTAAVLLFGLSILTHAQGSFKGYMFADYYTVLDHHDSDVKGQHGFWMRRVYLTFNSKLTEKIKMRLRLEMANSSFSKDKLTAIVKDAYLSTKLGGHELKAGIMSPPTFSNNVEPIWGYRALEKTPLDLFKFASSRDFGIGLKGTLDSAKKVTYSVMYGNGSSNKGETNAGKRVYGALAIKPAKGLTFEVYADYEHRSETDQRYVYQGFAAYEGNWGRIGVLYANQAFQNGTTYNLGLFSAFAVINASSKVDIIGRVDTAVSDDWESKFKGSGISYIPFANYVKPTLVILGVSFEAAKNIWLIPNIKYTTYSGSDAKNDIYANITLWFKFK